jgi:protein phosphatase
MNVRQRAAVTDPGRRRRHNEDAYVLEPPLFAVADGMGGAQAGEIASRIAASVLRDSGDPQGEDAVVALIEEANRRVYEAAATDDARSGMGTTMTAALVEDDSVRIGHVGDSRAYRIRDGRLEQLTEDHSLVGELVRSGRLSPEEADVHPQRSVITRVLGTDPEVDVDTFSVETRPGDIFMLCSDGLTSMVDDRTILDIVERNRSNLDRAARALVEAANRGGGEDNITVVAFEIGEPSTEEATPSPQQPEEPSPDDETTLSGLEPIPAIREPGRVVEEPMPAADDTMLLTRDELEALETPARKRRVSRTVIVLGSAAAVVILAALVVWTLSRSYFVGAQSDGHIAVYQGFPWNIVGGVKLYRVRYESPVLAGQLSRAERRRLFDHDLRSYDAALRAVKRYEAEVVP